MDLTKFLEAIAKLENGPDLVNWIKAELARRDGLATTNKTKATEHENALKAVRERYSKLAGHLGLDEDVEDLDAAIEELKQKSKGKVDNELQAQINALKEAMKKSKKENEAAVKAEIAKRHDILKKSEIMAALAANNAVKPELLFGMLTGKVKVGDNDALAFANDDGTECSVGDGVKAWLTSNPEFVINKQTGGAGGGGGAAGGGAESLAAKLAKQNVETTQAQIKNQEIYFK